MAAKSETSLLHLLQRALQIGTERFSREIGDTDITARQLVILRAIAANAGASQTAIVNITGMDRSTLGDLVKRLIKYRLISRKRSKSDARAYQLTITDDGAKAVMRAVPILHVTEQHMLSKVPAKERANFMAMLEALATAD